jgi:hypothetical protein
MKFKKLPSFKYYNVWVSNEIKGYKSYIFKLPYYYHNIYHFTIIYSGKIIYNSLSNDIYYFSRKDCQDFIEQWIKNN